MGPQRVEAPNPFSVALAMALTARQCRPQPGPGRRLDPIFRYGNALLAHMALIVRVTSSASPMCAMR